MSTEPTPETADAWRGTVAPLVLVVLAGTLALTDRLVDGTAQTVVRIVVMVALVGATAWTGRLLWGSGRRERGR